MEAISCGVMVRSGVMTELRPCIRKNKHGASHTPDLTSLKFGAWTVKGLAGPSAAGLTRWLVEVNGIERTAYANELLRGRRGKQVHVRSAEMRCQLNGKVRPEYSTVRQHWRFIFDTKCKCHKNYAGMPYHEEWNPQLGGAFWRGVKWILDNLGPKPSREWSLDIIEHDKGFVPGNLRWARYNQQARNQRHRGPGKMSVEELEAEARRHGFRLVPLERIAA